jgi:hypothetical protein
MVIEALTGLFTSGASVVGGGLIGLVGSTVTHYFDKENRKLDLETLKIKQDHEVVMMDKEAEVMAKEYEFKKGVFVIESDKEQSVSADNLQATSYTMLPKQYSNPSLYTKTQNGFMAFVDGFTGMVRPFLTLLFATLLILIYVRASDIVKGLPDLKAEDAVKIYIGIAETIMGLTSMMVGWWFGSRTVEQKKKRSLRK